MNSHSASEPRRSINPFARYPPLPVIASRSFMGLSFWEMVRPRAGPELRHSLLLFIIARQPVKSRRIGVNDLYAGYKTSVRVPPTLLSQFPALEKTLGRDECASLADGRILS